MMGLQHSRGNNSSNGVGGIMKAIDKSNASAMSTMKMTTINEPSMIHLHLEQAASR